MYTFTHQTTPHHTVRSQKLCETQDQEVVGFLMSYHHGCFGDMVYGNGEW